MEDDAPAPMPVKEFVHTLPNYVLALAAIGVVLFAAGAFGLVRHQSAGYLVQKKPALDGAGVIKVRKDSPQWIPYSKLTIPEGMQVHNDCGEEDCGTPVVSYDGTYGDDVVMKIPADNPNYPDLKITALSRSQKVVYLPRGVDKDTLEVTKTGSYIRDKNSVYFFTCTDTACNYSPLTGLDPNTFDPRTYAPTR